MISDAVISCRLDPKNKIFQSERRACIEAWKQKYHVPQTPPRVEIPIQATPPSPPQADHIDKAPDTKEGSSSYSSIQGAQRIAGSPKAALFSGLLLNSSPLAEKPICSDHQRSFTGFIMAKYQSAIIADSCGIDCKAV